MTILYLFLIVHFVADFILQTHWQAINKSSNNVALASHVASYTVCFALGALVILGFKFSFVPIMIFVLANGILHFVTDYVTSRITRELWNQKAWHNFFAVIGFDQLLHFSAIFLTLQYMGV